MSGPDRRADQTGVVAQLRADDFDLQRINQENSGAHRAANRVEDQFSGSRDAADEQNVCVAISDVVPIGKRNPGLAALRIATGEKLWHVPTPKPVCSWGTEKCEAAQSAAVTVIPGVVFSGAIDGHLRAYSTKDGRIIWDFDTVKSYDTVNGLKGNGGSLDVGGPTIAGGMLYVNSGYGVFFGHPGNVLLAFAVPGE